MTQSAEKAVVAALVVVLLLAAAVTLHVTAILPLAYQTAPLSNIRPVDGFAYLAGIPRVYPGAFEPDVLLLEDGKPFEMPNLPSSGTVAKFGGGRHHLQLEAVYFSTPDNSDPRTNGRSYEARLPWPLPRWPVRLVLLAGFVSAVALAYRARRTLWAGVSAPPFWVPALVLLMAVIANRAWFFLDFPMVAIHPDSGSYFAAAEMIGTSTWPNFGNRPPLYPIFLRLTFAMWDRAIAVAMFQTAFSFLAALLMLFACYRWRRSLAIPASLALALFLFGFTTLEHDTAMLSESVYSSLLVVSFAALMLGIRSRQPWWLGLSSASMALSILTRPAGMFLIVVYLLVAAWLLWQRFRRTAMVAFLIPLPVLLLALSVYNMRVVRAFTPTTWGEANLAVATFLGWQPDPSYPPEINADIEKIQSLLRARVALVKKDTAVLDRSWDPLELGSVFVEGFNQPALDIALRMGGHYETSARQWIRRISFDAIRKRPRQYAKFVWTMLYQYFRPIPEYDFRVYLQNRAATFYVERYFSPEKGNDFMVRLGKEFATSTAPPAVVITSFDPSVVMDQNDRIALVPTRAWRIYDLTHRFRAFVFERKIWPAALVVGLLGSLWILVRTRFRDEPAFVVFIVTIGAVGASLVVSLVEFSQPRYSYPMEWTYSVAMVLLPLLVLRRQPQD